MPTTDQPRPEFDPAAAVERFARVAQAAAEALSHMDTSLTLAEAQIAVARHHQTHRLAHESAGG